MTRLLPNALLLGTMASSAGAIIWNNDPTHGVTGVLNPRRRYFRTRGLRALTALLFCALLSILATAPATAAILSNKRGFADTGANYNNLQATGAGWYYTWGPGVGNPGNFDAKHYPMFWSTPSQGTINDVKNRNPEYVLGFNEPERPDQANLSVAQAIASWTTISNSFAGTSTKLVSPAVSDGGNGPTWLTEFMQQATANNLKVDAVAFHWYGVSNPNDPSRAAGDFLSRVDDYYNRYSKPVFITEFAIHDWGGAYSDAAIIEANRQFLNIVIPALESRSHVAGYAWYHWFSDAPLYTGNPMTPTPMGYSYVGAIGSGQQVNLNGLNLGEHVAYLTGGDLTLRGNLTPTIRYINALASTSTISGSTDWSLTGNSWVRIQAGATLRKLGSNQITFSGGTITNNGLLEVNQGTLRIGSPVTGTGDIRVNGGTLAPFGAGTISVSPLIDVRPGGTLNVAALTRGLNLGTGQTLNVEAGATVVGIVTALNGVTISGGGNFSGNLTSRVGSIVRVGMSTAGSPWSASTLTIDGNFTQEETASLQIDLGGAATGMFDVLEVGGTASLAGKLQVGLANGFAPAAGDLFPILSAMNIQGLPSLSGQADGFSLVRTAAGLSLYFGDLPAGDYDQNGIVDTADYQTWQLAFGTTVAPNGSGADGNADGIVDAADFNVWRDNVGATIYQGQAAGWAAQVPEPAAGSMFALGILSSPLAIAARRHRRR